MLLLDEPSAALDPRQRERLWEFVGELTEAGTTIVYSTHNVQEAERHAHQVVLPADGERLFSGSPGGSRRSSARATWTSRRHSSPSSTSTATKPRFTCAGCS